MPIDAYSHNAFIAMMRKRWKQGEHVALIGPTGSGKTTLAQDLLQVRSYVCVLAIKAHDDSIERYRGSYKLITKWPPGYEENHVVLWIKPRSLQDFQTQRIQVTLAMEEIYVQGGWCIYLDDLSYMVDHMRLRNVVTAFLNQGRSNGISVVSSVQRPRRVPLEAFSQARHFLVWRFEDIEDVKRAAEIAGYPKRELLAINKDLGPYDAVAMSSRQKPIIVVGK